MNQIELGKFIYKLRIEANLTQDELAKKVDVGSGKTVSKWENGYSMPDFITLKKLSIVLNVTLYELSECKRLKKKRYIEATNDYIKHSIDIFKLNIIGKITIIIAILLGIFLGLCAIFTISNYGTVEIYTLESIDKDFYINGNITFTKKYNYINLIDIDYVGKNDNMQNSKITNVTYRILDKKTTTIILYSTIKYKENMNIYTSFIDNIKSLHFTIPLTNDTLKEVKFDDKEIFTFQISYEDKDKKVNNIEFPFRIIEKYKNNFKNMN